MKIERSILTVILYLLVGVFVLIVGTMAIPALRGYINFLFIMISGALLLLLGGALIFLTLKQKVKGRLKKFLILTGVSAGGYTIFSILHNLFYGLAEITSHITIFSYLMKAFEVIFFLIAVFACPIGFLVGIIGSLVLLIKERKKEEEVKELFRDKDR